MKALNASKLVCLLLAATLSLSACTTPKPKEDAFNSAERAIDAAIKAGAEQHAPVELRFAREKLAEARKGIEYKQFEDSTERSSGSCY